MKTKVLLISMMSLTSCIKRTSPEIRDESSLKWGFLNINSNNLIKMPNNSVINVCGPYFNEVKNAVNIWAQAIDRKLDVRQSCENVTIQVNISKKENQTESLCNSYPGNVLALTDRNPMEIVECYPSVASEHGLIGNIIIHEVGHLWGLCDMHGGGKQNCSYIHDQNWMDNPDADSVMKYSLAHDHLLEDDIAGIVALAQQYPTSGGNLDGSGVQTPQKDPQVNQNAVSWTCNQSQYNGAQYWTCGPENARYICEGCVPKKEACSPLSCKGKGTGINDECN